MEVLDKYLIRTSGVDIEHTDNASAAASEKSTEAPLLNNGPSQGQRILVIEDDIDAAELMQLLLIHQGHQVDIAQSGEEAMKKLHHNDFDHALLDLTLPDYQGFDLAPKLRNIAPGLNIVVVSGREPDAHQLEEHHIYHALLKPVSKQDLTRLFEE